MSRDPPLPPLNALRAFEAVARHGNVTRAARELGVTQTAASHQVANLEAVLGADLLTRAPGGVALTPLGRAWAAALADVFERLRLANRRLRGPPGNRLVSVTVMPSFATRWLVPRLGRFLAANPGIDVRISSTERLVDFATEEVDVGVRYAPLGKVGPSLGGELLFEDAWLVVCAPTLRTLTDVRDLADAVVLHDDEAEAWGRWTAAVGHPSLVPRRRVELSDHGQVVEAAVRGAGYALARVSLAADELAAGRLVRAVSGQAPVPTGRAYHIVGPPGEPRPEVAAWRAWLREEVESLRRGAGEL